MGNDLIPYSMAIGWENYYLLAPNFKSIKKDKIDLLKRIRLITILYWVEYTLKIQI